TALAADTALAEREGILLTGTGIKAKQSIRTALLLHIQCHLGAMLDLSDERIRHRLKVSLTDLLGPWLPWNVGGGEADAMHAAPSQQIGEAVYASGRFEAIRAPCAKDPHGYCLAIFPDRLRPTSHLEIEDPGGTIRGALGMSARRE